MCFLPYSSLSKWKHWERAEGRFVDRMNSQDPSCVIFYFPIFLWKQVGKNTQQEMLREHTRGKIMLGSTWRNKPAEWQWSCKCARWGCRRTWFISKGVVYLFCLLKHRFSFLCQWIWLQLLTIKMATTGKSQYARRTGVFNPLPNSYSLNWDKKQVGITREE